MYAEEIFALRNNELDFYLLYMMELLSLSWRNTQQKYVKHQFSLIIKHPLVSYFNGHIMAEEMHHKHRNANKYELCDQVEAL